MRLHKPAIQLLLPLLSLAFTAFVFANTYEVVMNRDIAFAQSIKKVAAQDVINTTIREFQTKPNTTDISSSQLQHLEHFEIPALKSRIQLEEARNINGQWYERPSTGHYIGLNKDANNTTIDYLIYLDKSWQTMPLPGQIEEGMEVQFRHDNGAVSAFTVAEKKVLPLKRSLLVSKTEDRQIIIIIEDAAHDIYYGYSLIPRK